MGARIFRSLWSRLGWMAVLACPAFPQATEECDLLRSSSLQESGRQALAKRAYDTAAQHLERAYQACPAQDGVLLDLSRAQVQARRFAEGVQTARGYLARHPDSVPGRVALANAHFMAQQWSEARQESVRALHADPANPDALMIKGNVEYLSGEFEAAENTLLQLLERHPENSEAAYMLGRMYYQEGRIDQAMGQFLRVLKIDPRSYKAYDNLGLCYQARGDKETAVRYFLTAIKLVENDHPEYDWAYANLASLLLEMSDAEKAYAAAAKAAERNPYSARNFFLGGKALCKLNKTELCINWLERSTALDPNYADPLYLLARVYSQLGQADKARETNEKFRQAKAREPARRR